MTVDNNILIIINWNCYAYFKINNLNHYVVPKSVSFLIISI